ncbi:MAG: DUF4830 domain-containing protein [Ruminococcaceae bacterium]|nr:DUF4830 domain-containing protein [Oscillospiraceae bacterium]
MRRFFTKNLILILSLILLSLLFILWGRIIIKEIQKNTHTHQLTTTEARVRCLALYGWEVDPAGETERFTTIPDPLDAVYIEYNRLQTVCGFDLSRYCGKRVACYGYPVLNFPYPTEEPVFVNLLVYEGRLIGGDCMSRALDGFMLPLDRAYLP